MACSIWLHPLASPPRFAGPCAPGQWHESATAWWRPCCDQRRCPSSTCPWAARQCSPLPCRLPLARHGHASLARARHESPLARRVWPEVETEQAVGNTVPMTGLKGKPFIKCFSTLIIIYLICGEGIGLKYFEARRQNSRDATRNSSCSVLKNKKWQASGNLMRNISVEQVKNFRQPKM